VLLREVGREVTMGNSDPATARGTHRVLAGYRNPFLAEIYAVGDYNTFILNLFISQLELRRAVHTTWTCSN
jgi:hypothetical protein